ASLFSVPTIGWAGESSDDSTRSFHQMAKAWASLPSARILHRRHGVSRRGSKKAPTVERRDQGPPCCHGATAKRRPLAGRAEHIEVSAVLAGQKRTEQPIHNSSSNLWTVPKTAMVYISRLARCPSCRAVRAAARMKGRAARFSSELAPENPLSSPAAARGAPCFHAVRAALPLRHTGLGG